MDTRIYRRTGSINPPRSVFDLSYSKIFNCNQGELIPVTHDEVVPGDVLSIANECVIRFQPLLAPVLHEINCYVHYFFVPYRLLWEDWEDFITGGTDGDDTSSLPLWQPSASQSAKYTLWDYFGFPIGLNLVGYDFAPIDFPRIAYNRVYNAWYLDQTNQTARTDNTNTIAKRAWEKDYFTSALPWQQRGTAPALPISGSIPVTGIGAQNTTWTTGPTNAYETGGTGTTAYANYKNMANDADNQRFLAEEDPNNSGYPNVRVDLSGGTTFDVADLRLAFQIQKWMERNARAGARYTEFLKAHFGVSPRDDRLDRPEYIGGTKQSVIVSEVAQTSSSDATSDQGNLAGHGLSAGSNFAGKYRVQEYGMILGLMSIMPRTVYGQGINRQWLRQTRYDFYTPEFANLSEQSIYTGEIYYDGTATDEVVFGYQGNFDEMRTKQSMYCSDMRDTFDYWHLGRQFASAPSLNGSFIQCTPDTRIFAAESEPGCIVHFNNRIKAYRPLPVMSNPGLIDH